MPYKKKQPLKKPQAGFREKPTQKEIKYYGTAACLELWKNRPEDVIRAYLTKSRVDQFSAMLKWAAAQKKAYHIVEDEDLGRLTESTHHQGICVLAVEKKLVSFAQLKTQLKQERRPTALVYLDGVENPHNLGAIVRTCAHFGIAYVLGAQGKLPGMSPAACRVAEGGAEHVDLVALSQPLKQLAELSALGFAMVTTSASGHSLFKHAFAANTIIVMGAESSGVSKPIAQAAATSLSVPGSGHVESLNVSVAFAVTASEYCRQHLTPK